MTRDYRPAIGLGLTQIMGYGTLMYAYAVLLSHMADDLGLSLSAVFGILSLGLFFGGLVAPLAGALVDRFGGRWVMTIASVVAGIALTAIVTFFLIPDPRRETHDTAQDRRLPEG